MDDQIRWPHHELLQLQVHNFNQAFILYHPFPRCLLQPVQRLQQQLNNRLALLAAAAPLNKMTSKFPSPLVLNGSQAGMQPLYVSVVYLTCDLLMAYLE